MDDIIKLLQQLMSQKPRPKGGIADTAEGVEFLGKALSKEEKGSLLIVNSRLTDASQFKPFSIGVVGKDKRFKLISDYEKDLSNEFNRTIEFLKANPDIRLTELQKDNIYYNLGIFRRLTEEKNKLEKSIIEDGKKPSNVLDMEGNVLNPNKPIIGGTQSKEDLIKTKKTTDVEEAIDNVSPGFVKGDRKYNAQLVADDLAEKRFGKNFSDLDQTQQMDLYGEALDGLPQPKFRLNVDRFQKDFNVSDEDMEKILALSSEEQQKILKEYIDKDFKQQIELADFDVTDKEPNAQGGIVGLRI
tara:strand:- start:1528 stop:2430 length:903 start_codon:yes stop_codon:yes gene_type:complete